MIVRTCRIEHRNVNIGSGANTPGRAGRPIEHPGRNLQPSPGCPTREAATENLSASLLNHLMNMDQASGPRMPRIKKLVLRDPVGVPSSCCTTRYGRIYLWRKMRRSPAPPNSPGTFLVAQFSAGYTTNMSGFDLRQAHLIRDRDRIYSSVVTRRLRAMGIRDKPTALASPWQNGFAERLIGSIRRECLDHVIVLGEAHLRRILKNYAAYYNGVRTHRSLQKDAPVSRPVQRSGGISSRANLGGLHHRYARV